jgi:dTMP kinase
MIKRLITPSAQGKGVKGLLITLEGIDGSGKSTAARDLVPRLQELVPGRRWVLTAEPTKGEVGRVLRARLKGLNELEPASHMEELFLFMADHADHLKRTILPSLQEGTTVISDRYADSTVAYQGVTLRGIVPDPVKWIQNLLKPWNVVPSRTLFFAIDPVLALERISSRDGREKFERLDFLKEVDKNFEHLVSREPERFTRIDASLDPDEVSEIAVRAVLDLIRRG